MKTDIELHGHINPLQTGCCAVTAFINSDHDCLTIKDLCRAAMVDPKTLHGKDVVITIREVSPTTQCVCSNGMFGYDCTCG